MEEVLFGERPQTKSPLRKDSRGGGSLDKYFENVEKEIEEEKMIAEVWFWFWGCLGDVVLFFLCVYVSFFFSFFLAFWEKLYGHDGDVDQLFFRCNPSTLFYFYF